MTDFSKTLGKALTVLVVSCVPLFAYQTTKDTSATNTKDLSSTHFYQKKFGITDRSISVAEPKIAAANPAAQQSWIVLPDIKNARFESTAVQYRDDVYVFNGFGIGIDIEPAVEMFDAGTQKWSVIGNTSIAKGNAVTHNGVIKHGDEVWILGGRVGDHPGAVTSKVWIYNLTSKEWSAGPKLPVPGAAGGAALVGNRIHWFGGLDTNAQCDVANHYVYDLANPSGGWNDISGIAPMPIPRNHFATVVHDGLIYAIGGQFTHGGCGAGTPDTDLVHAFNPATNTWTQKASLPTIQSHIEPSTFVYKDAIYVVGGATAGNKVYRYDPSNDIWDTVAVLPQALLAPVARVVDNMLIVSSGGAPSIIPSKKTYATDITPLLLPDVNNIDTNTATDSNSPNDTGLVSLEAEYHDTVTTTATHQWVTINKTGASNNAAMTTTPDSGHLNKGSQDSPSMAYFAYFDRPGTWYLWIRGWGDTINGQGGSDSLHAGLNGSMSATADKIDNFPPGWNWSSSTRDGDRASLTIPSAGIHAVNLWMREDGLVVDRILLSTDPDYQPTGIGDAPADNETLAHYELADIETLDNTEPADNDASFENEISTNASIPVDEPAPEVTSGDATADNSQSDENLPDASGSTISSTEDTLSGSTDDTTSATTAAESTLDSPEASAEGPLNSAGIIAIEIENYDTKKGASNKQWIRSGQSGASGSASMVTTPDTGILKNNNQNSPVMNYKVYFEEAGTYKVWLRGWGDTNGNEGKNDSAHVGINGALNSAAGIQNFPPKWSWSTEKRSGGSASLQVPAPGLHTINIWMREDGLILDKLILAKSAVYIPSGLGHATQALKNETLQNAASPEDESVEITDNSETDSDSLANTVISIDNSLVSAEIENYTSKTENGGHQWQSTNKPGSSSSAMVATPNSGKLNNKANGSALNYSLQFSEAGTYYVWLRGWGDSNGAGKNDSVHVGINGNQNTTQVLENFPDSWTWSNKKRTSGRVTVKIPTAGIHTLNLSMREDGIILDKLILTKDASLIPSAIGPATTVVNAVSPANSVEDNDTNAILNQNFVAIRIEAEDFTSKSERWVLTSPDNKPNFQDDPDAPHNNSASGKANLELLPDTRVTHSDPVSGGPDGSLWGNPGPGPRIDYLINLPEAGRYLVYVKTFSTGSEDNGIHVGINGTMPNSGKRIQTCAKNKWIWTSAQRTNEEHCGVRKQIWVDVPAAGPNKITFYAREDGFELDQFLLLKENNNDVLDCFPTRDDQIRCTALSTGAKISETDIPVSNTVGGENASSSPIPASRINFGGQWQNRYTTDGSTVQKRHEAGGVAFNGKLYLLGGRGTRNVSIYDPTTNKWSYKTAPPIELNHFQPVEYNGKIWVIGAFTGPYPNETAVADIYTYTPATNSWAKEGKIPQNRRRGSTGAVLHDGYIYIVGGNANGHKSGAKPWLDRFNPTTGEWQVLSDAPTARDHITASVSNNKLVVAAGRQSAYPNVFANTVSTTNVYNFETQLWAIAKPIPTQRAGAMVVTAGHEVVVIGGETGNSIDAKATVESYNVVTDTWRQLSPLQTGRHSGGAMILNNEIHVVSGSERKGGSPESTAHEVIDF